ncbi:MAG: Fic family protein [Aliarcobacter sp.]|nr:Fic family protein [Aliarcobacter sp.]
MSLIYISIEQAIETHGNTIDVSGGGVKGHLEIGKLESCLAHIQNDDYYPTFEEKLCHLFFCANKFHSFQDGNKRIAISLGAQFLLLNGYVFLVPIFIREMENISYYLAEGKIPKDLLLKIINAVLNDELDDESLKLEIFNAISE